MTSKVVLVGSSSRAARAIRRVLGDRQCVLIARHSDPAIEAVKVPDYRQVPAGIDLAGAVVINCVGTPLGTASELMSINRNVPVAWATAAREREASAFVQLSSFSVYRLGHIIDHATQLAPLTDYGRSKLAAEQALASLSREDFAVAQIRVPILVGFGNDKLAQLVRAARRTRLVPDPGRPVPRPMLSYSGLAAVVAHLVDRRQSGIHVAADPEPFDYPLLREEAAAAGVRTVALRVPGLAQRLTDRVAPGLYRSMFEPMPVSDEVNVALTALPFERVRDVVARLLRES